jgi:hypothetical protein
MTPTNFAGGLGDVPDDVFARLQGMGPVEATDLLVLIIP